MIILFLICWFTTGFISGCIYFHDLQDIGDANFKKETYYDDVFWFFMFFFCGFISFITAFIVVCWKLHNSEDVGYLLPFSRKSKEAAGIL